MPHGHMTEAAHPPLDSSIIFFRSVLLILGGHRIIAGCHGI